MAAHMIDEDGRVVHELVLPRAREAGGRFRFEVQPGQFCEGQYVEVDPPARVVFSWGWTDPWWDLPPGASLVEVDLTEVDLGGQGRALHDEGWPSFLERLAAAAAGGEPAPYPRGDPARRLEALHQGPVR